MHERMSGSSAAGAAYSTFVDSRTSFDTVRSGPPFASDAAFSSAGPSHSGFRHGRGRRGSGTRTGFLEDFALASTGFATSRLEVRERVGPPVELVTPPLPIGGARTNAGPR